MKELSQIVSELFARPADGRELSSQIQRLGDEIRKKISSEETIFGRFQGLLESFRMIIPDERQRYQAALQALSTTAKLGRQEIMQAINGQAEELKLLEKGLAPAQQAWREGLKGLEARSQQIKAEAAQVRARLAQLESEDQALQAGMAAQEKDLAQAEGMVKNLFAGISTDILALHRKVTELTAEAAAAPVVPAVPVQPAAVPAPPAQPAAPQPAVPQPAPAPPAEQPAPKKAPAKVEAPARKKKEEAPKDAEPKAEEPKAAEPETEITGAKPQADSKFQKKCPMCGGPFNLLEFEKIWQCYTCGHEEPMVE